MINFTQTYFKKLGLGLVTLLLCLSSIAILHAQDEYTLTVNSPAGIAGDYNTLIASFGSGARPCTLSGDLILINDAGGASVTDGCDTILNDLTGRIAVIDRGSCDFSSKVYRAQQKGAIAVLMVNNQTTDIFSMGAGTNANLVTIPSFMVSQANGNAIKAQLASGVNVTFTEVAAEQLSASAEPIIWGDQPGEGDFDGGLNGWTSTTLSCTSAPDTFDLWQWNPDGTIISSCAEYYLFSPTRCNGVALFASDAADNGGDDCGTLGTGPCPSPHAAELTSPTIDISGSTSTEDLILRFYQSSLLFQGAYYVAWTTDNGATWDTTQINTELVQQEFTATPDIVRVNLAGTQGQSQLQVKFIFDADYYFWAIDDVAIVEKAANNLALASDFYATAQNYATPLAHVEPVAFLSDIANIGTADQTNVNLNTTVFFRAAPTAAFAPVFSTDLSYGTVAAGDTVENIPFVETFTPTQIGQYAIQYAISADSADAQQENDFEIASFLVTNNQFSKEAAPTTGSRPSDAEWDVNEPRSWAWGNYYYVPDAAGNYVQTVSFGVFADQTVAGRELVITLYEWVDENEDEQADPDERIPVSFAAYTMTGSENGSLITIPFPGGEEDPVQLKDSTAYLMMVEYFAPDQATFFLSASDAIDYGAMVLVNDSIDRPRYAGLLGINDDLSIEPYSTLGFGYDLVPAVRMTVGPLVSTKDLNKLDSEFVVFPNPTSEAVNLQLNLSAQAQTATVRLFDLSGRMIQQWNYDNVQKERYQYNVKNLSSGTYFLQVITAEGAGTKKFTVSK